MWKNILSVVVGLIAGFLIFYALEALSNKMYPLPPFFDLKKADWETAKFFVDMIPVGAFLIVLLAYVFGSVMGGFLSFLISEKIQQPLIVGSAFMIGGIVNLFMLPQPLWFAIISVMVFLPFALVGGRIGMIIKKKKNESSVGQENPGFFKNIFS